MPLQAQPVAKTADEQWSDLVQLTKGNPGAARSRADAPAARQAQQAHLQKVANEAAKFARDNPTHPQAAEARRWEAKSRLTGALLDATAPSASVQALATETRRDARLPVAARYEVAFLAEVAGETGRKIKDHGARLAAREQSARALIAEFPDQPGGYGLLLQVAARRTGAPAAALARDLTASGAPAEIKAAAQDLLDRQALEPAAGQPLILYTWSPERPAAHHAARRQLMTRVTPHTGSVR